MLHGCRCFYSATLNARYRQRWAKLKLRIKLLSQVTLIIYRSKQ